MFKGYKRKKKFDCVYMSIVKKLMWPLTLCLQATARIFASLKYKRKKKDY